MHKHDIDILIADKSKKKYSFVTKGISENPVYLVVNDRVVSQIGEFE